MANSRPGVQREMGGMGGNMRPQPVALPKPQAGNVSEKSALRTGESGSLISVSLN